MIIFCPYFYLKLFKNVILFLCFSYNYIKDEGITNLTQGLSKLSNLIVLNIQLKYSQTYKYIHYNRQLKLLNLF